ncbi:hypothetical protein RMATCC62417_11999 [Rhizopus microsporus]|nr:hypothetical protein RMATCC62417_11999 [Rhizopus microsporus]
MNSSTEVNIAAYSPVPEFQVTDIAQYKQVIESHIIKYGVKWVIKKITRNNITDQELDGARCRPRADYLWRSFSTHASTHTSTYIQTFRSNKEYPCCLDLIF